MKKRLLDNERLKQVSLYSIAAVVCVLIQCLLFRIWRADLRVPFYYSGDSIFYLMFTKGVIENGWYWQNPSIGAPGGLQMYEFPTFDNGVTVIFWLFSRFTHDAPLILNLFYLLSFPLITLASVYVFRQFNLSYVPSLVCGLLYAFLPFHFMRNQTHLILSAYYVVPLAVLVMLWLTTEDLFPRTKKFVFSVAICVLLGSSGVYYPFFFCFLLLVAGAIGSLKLQRLRPLATALVFAGITTATVAINLSPSLIYKYRHEDAGAMLRSPHEAELYGLKISQLVLPITGHRIDLLDQAKRFHNANSMISENDTASLGIVGSIGFLGLLAQLLHRRELFRGASGIFQDLSILNVFALLLGIIGGFGLLFSLLLSAGIRSYNRISVFIAFFSLMGVVIALQRIYPATTRERSIFHLLMVVVLVGGFLDQTTPVYVPHYTPTKAEFLSDKDFVNRIEGTMPDGAMIFQLPYIPFPEFPRIQKMIDYDHFRGYVHSKNLRWSYGTVKNREGDLAQQRVAALPAEELIQTLAFAGFSGIYVDRYGYEDGGTAIEWELSRLLQTGPLISPNDRLLFFNITDYRKRLREQYPDSEWEAKKEFSFNPMLLDWKGGFSGFESRPGKTWRWCSNEGELHVKNTAQRPRTIKLEMAFATGYDELDDLIISGLISEHLKVNNLPSLYSKTITVPPGESVIYFRSTARRVDAPLDTRFLVFRIEDFKMTELQ